MNDIDQIATDIRFTLKNMSTTQQLLTKSNNFTKEQQIIFMKQHINDLVNLSVLLEKLTDGSEVNCTMYSNRFKQ